MRRLLLVVFAISMILTEAPCDARSSAQKAVAELGEIYMQKAPPSAFRRAVAVLPIEATGNLGRGGAADAIAAFIREKLALSTAFTLVERANMQAILSEIELGLSGLADPSKAARAGELLGAELLVQGSISEIGETLVLSLELVDASTGQVIASVARPMEKADVIASGGEYLRSSFQSQYGISVYGGGGAGLAIAEYYLPDFTTDPSTSNRGNPVVGFWDLGVSYRLLRWLGLDLGVMGLAVPQFYFSEDGKVLSPLAGANRSIRYSEFSGNGISLGATAIYSPLARFNIGLSARGFMLLAPKLTHWFMDFLNYDITDAGAVEPVNRDIVIEGSMFAPSFGAYGDARVEYLISKRMSVGLTAGYFWMMPFIPDRYVTGNQIHVSNEAGEFPTYQDKNGTFDFMGGFNVARIDGTTGSDPVSLDPSCVYATAFLAVHF